MSRAGAMTKACSGFAGCVPKIKTASGAGCTSPCGIRRPPVSGLSRSCSGRTSAYMQIVGGVPPTLGLWQ